MRATIAMTCLARLIDSFDGLLVLVEEDDLGIAAISAAVVSSWSLALKSLSSFSKAAILAVCFSAFLAVLDFLVVELSPFSLFFLLEL